LPFAGAIGEKKLIHDPLLGAKGKNFASLKDLSAAAEIGDIVLTAKPQGSIWRHAQLPTTGSEWYHAQGILDKAKGYGANMTWEQVMALPDEITEDVLGMAVDELDELPPKEKRQALATLQNEIGSAKATTLQAGYFKNSTEKEIRALIDKGFTPEQIREYAGGIERLAPDLQGHNYQDVALLRPKTPMTPEQVKTFQNEMLVRGTKPYSQPTALKVWLKNLFLPKFEGMEKVTGGLGVNCKNNVCSTMPAQSYQQATARSILAGKRPQDLAPADYLRSGEYELVGSRLDPSKFRLSPRMRKALPWITRGGVGAGLAAGTYGATQEPAALAAVPGAAGGYLAGRALTQKAGPRFGVSQAASQKMFPDMRKSFDLVHDLLDSGKGVKKTDLVKPLLKGGVPSALAGAATGVAAAKGLEYLYKRPDMPWNT
jgi:hypothetical protein